MQVRHQKQMNEDQNTNKFNLELFSCGLHCSSKTVYTTPSITTTLSRAVPHPPQSLAVSVDFKNMTFELVFRCLVDPLIT